MAFLTSGKSPRKKSRVPGHRLHFPFSKTEKICHAQPRRRPQKVCRKNHFYNLIAKKQRIVFSPPHRSPSGRGEKTPRDRLGLGLAK